MSLKNMFFMNAKAAYFAHALKSDEIRFFRIKGGVRSIVASIVDTEQSGLLFCETDGQSKIVARLIKEPETDFRNPDRSLPKPTENQIEVKSSDNRTLILRNDSYSDEIITDAVICLAKEGELKLIAHVFLDYNGELIFDFTT